MSSNILTGIGNANPEVAVLRKDIEGAMGEFSKGMGQHLGQLYGALEAQLRALEALDARIEVLEKAAKSAATVQADREGKEI